MTPTNCDDLDPPESDCGGDETNDLSIRFDENNENKKCVRYVSFFFTTLTKVKVYILVGNIFFHKIYILFVYKFLYEATFYK